ncbi:neurotrophin 1 isoform 1-T1 [Cochliomyia hominivorax]
MKMGKSLRCLFWATLYCVLYLVSASDEDLMDFDFSDLKEIDWNYENDNSKELLHKGTTEENIITFDDDNDLLEENQVHPFDWREKVLRTALSKALSNKAVRQKFVEVMPILRVLSKQQRLALSALITAQINAKKGNELKLDQVRMMFGDDKSLILPIVYDIANLVRNSAKKYIEFDYNLADFGDFSKTKISYERRNLELSPEEAEAEENNEEGIGTLPATAQMTQGMDLDGLEDFMSDEILDPKEINEELEILKTESLNKTESNKKLDLDNVDMELEIEAVDDGKELTDPLNINQELQKDVPTLTLLKLNKTSEPENAEPTGTNSTTPKVSLKRIRRSARQPEEFVHKLVRSVPLSEEEKQRLNGARSLKLNTTAFASPKESNLRTRSTINTSSISTTINTTTTQPPPIIVTTESEPQETYEPYQLIEDLAIASLNGSEVLHDDIDTSESELVSEAKMEPDEEILPTPEELIATPRYRVSGNKLIPMRSKVIKAKRKRVQVRARPKTGAVDNGNGVPPPKKCERFTASMCLKTDDYPMDKILGSIRRHRNAMTALLAEYTDKPSNALDNSDDFDDYIFNKKRREDNDLQGGLCQSIVRYARPQKARSASGEWKYIVNTGQHTQTLRLEKCMNPQESCSYLSSNYKSHCAQVYNYHRLLSWDKTRGLHVDIFKVPTCCSCQIDGYKQQFPALASQTKNDFTPVYKDQMYRQYQQLDYRDEEDDDENDYNFSLQHQQHKHDSSFDADELSSNRVKSRVPSPTVGSYLSPPGNQDYDQHYLYKSQQHSGSPSSAPSSSSSSSKYYSREVLRRRPHKSYSDSRSDQDYSPSEQHTEREVKKIGTAIGNEESYQQNQNNIYSVTHTANTGSSGFSDSSNTAFTTSTGTIHAVTTPSPPNIVVYQTRPRRPSLVVTNAHQKPYYTSTTTTADKSSSPAAVSTKPSTADGSVGGGIIATTLPAYTASLPTHYYTRSRHVLKNQSRLRIPYTITSTRPGNDDVDEEDYTETTDEFGYDDSTATTTATSSTFPSSQPSNVYGVNREILKNQYKTKLNVTYSTASSKTSGASGFSPSSTSPPKRINYSYHPIIDFFEYNRRVTAMSLTTTKSPPLSSSSSPSSPSSSKASTENSLKYLSSTHLYPHKILKVKSALNYQQSLIRKQHEEKQKQQQQQQQTKYQSQQNERRIGYGAAASSTVAAVALATDVGDGSNNPTNSNNNNNNNFNDSPKINNYNIDTEPLSPVLITPSDIDVSYDYETSGRTDVWHPMIIHDF